MASFGMRKLIFLALLGLLAACSTPSSSDPSNPTTQQRAEAQVDEALAYFGSNADELTRFVEAADPTLADRILVNSQQSAPSGDSDRAVTRSVQLIASRMEQLKASPARFAQLCERLRFTVIMTGDYAYPFARVHENICWRGSQGDPTATPTVSPAGSGA